MTKNGKILLGCGGVLGVVAVIVIVVGAYVFYSMNRDFEKSSKALQESVKRDENAGAEFGKATDQNGCMAEGFRLSRLTYQERDVTIYTFVHSCLENSKPVQDFCVGVPPFSYPNDHKWMEDECRKAGLDALKNDCDGVFGAKQFFCDPKIRATKKTN